MRAWLPSLLLLSGFASAQVTINEIRVGEAGPDLNEYFELRVAPGESLAGLTYVVIGANAIDGSGVIEVAVALPAVVPTAPYYLVGESSMTIATPDYVAILGMDDQQNSTHYLVSGFTGSVGQDLDVDDDWTLDLTPWTHILDGVVFSSSSDPTTLTYGGALVGIDAVPFQPSLHAGRFSYGWYMMAEDFSADTPGDENGGGPAVDSRCWTAQPNGSGRIVYMLGTYSSIAGSGLHLEVSGGEFGSVGYILVGTGDASFNPLTVSNGHLCLSTAPGNRLGRYNVSNTAMNSIGFFDQSRELQNLAGTSSTGTGFDVPSTLPLTGAPMIQAGQTFYFQCWYREQTQGQSNFSTSVGVRF